MRRAALLWLLMVACRDARTAEKPQASPPVAASPLAVSEDWYPDDITPPEGTQYPCALTALPRDLPGIPAADRTYVNHAYSLLLRATQEKLRLLRALETNEGTAAAHVRYDEETARLLATLRAEAVPGGLERFQDDVAAALELQRAFFAEAVKRRDAGASMPDVYAIPEGRQASARLIAGWNAMQRRYPSWTPEVKDSVYHHLCALDLF